MTESWRGEQRSSSDRGYGHRWRLARAEFLRANPLCWMCHETGHIVEATVVDHDKPHRGDMKMFWDRANWRALCKTHHDGAKQRLEATGHLVGGDTSGFPLDPNHGWNKQ